MDQISNISQLFAAQKYKLTPQREAIVNILLDNEKDHLSVEEVYMLVKNSYPHLGLATVYRTLELLCELHIVEKMNFGDGVARYDLRGNDHSHMHHHLICSVCGRLEEIKDDWLVELEKEWNVNMALTSRITALISRALMAHVNVPAVKRKSKQSGLISPLSNQKEEAASEVVNATHGAASFSESN